MKRSQETQLLHNFERDSKWFHENINKLRKEGFTGKFVAVKDAKLFAFGEDMNIVINKIEEKGGNPSHLFIEFVHPEGFTLIL